MIIKYNIKKKLTIKYCCVKLARMAELVDACGLKPHLKRYRFKSDYGYILLVFEKIMH